MNSIVTMITSECRMLYEYTYILSLIQNTRKRLQPQI